MKSLTAKDILDIKAIELSKNQETMKTYQKYLQKGKIKMLDELLEILIKE